MNVTFSVQTEFDDIPREIAYLLQAVQKELDLVADNAGSLSRTIVDKHTDQESLLNHGKTELLSLHNIRLHMAKIDTRMEDCMAILNGYIDHIENPSEAGQEPSEQEVHNEEG
jgi:hypothetical protein